MILKTLSGFLVTHCDGWRRPLLRAPRRTTRSSQEFSNTVVDGSSFEIDKLTRNGLEELGFENNRVNEIALQTIECTPCEWHRILLRVD